jgi:hypothetical protein
LVATSYGHAASIPPAAVLGAPFSQYVALLVPIHSKPLFGQQILVLASFAKIITRSLLGSQLARVGAAGGVTTAGTMHASLTA